MFALRTRPHPVHSRPSKRLLCRRAGVTLDFLERLVPRDRRDLVGRAARLGQSSRRRLTNSVRGASFRQLGCLRRIGEPVSEAPRGVGLAVLGRNEDQLTTGVSFD